MNMKKYKISIFFNGNRAFDRGIICGIGEYLQASQCDWDVYIEEDFYSHKKKLDLDYRDGVIVDLNNPQVKGWIRDLNCAVVGVGGAKHNADNYEHIPYVSTDNHALVKIAFEHLKSKGFLNFGFYGLPISNLHLWAIEREKSFKNIAHENGFSASVYRGFEGNSDNWNSTLLGLSDWLLSLEKPTGIIAVTDSRARHLLQVCDHLGILVPEQVSIIGIDNDDLIQYLSKISLSSVGHGTKEMGYLSAKLLHQKLSGDLLGAPRILVPPETIYERYSTDYKPFHDPYVIQAIHYINLNACKGIKVEQVVDYVGLSRSNLESRFKKETNHTIHYEIHNFKLERVKKLLSETDLSIIEISEVCGYPTHQYMYSVFRKECGVTPGQFRLKRR